MLNVLLTGGGGAGSVSLFQQYSQKYKLIFTDSNIRAINPAIPRAQTVESLPIGHNDFAEQMAELCNMFDIDIVIPGIDEELLIWRNKISPHINSTLLLPDHQFIETALDKQQCCDYLSSIGLTAPSTVLASASDYPESDAYVLKPISGRGSRDVYLINDAHLIEPILKNIGCSPDQFVVQERIYGDEYTVGVLVDKAGRLVSIVPLKIISKKGITISSVSCVDEQITEYCQKLHFHLKSPGYYNIQLIKTKDGVVYPFEINPRVSTTTCQFVAAGIDLIGEFLRESVSAGTDLLPFKCGLRLDRFYTNIFTEASP